MRLSSIFSIAGVFLAAAIVSLICARIAVSTIEETSRNAVRDTLDENGLIWTEVDTDGLEVLLAGEAPSEAVRFKALSIAGSVVDATRVIDLMAVKEKDQLPAPRFSMEILRNDSGVSLIGLVPATMDRDDFVADIRAAVGDRKVADFLEVASYPAPETWQDAADYALRALRQLDRAKISVGPEHVAVTAMTENAEDKARVEAELSRRVPEDVALALNISAPRPVITPFTLRFVIEDGQFRFDACSADTEEARARILAAARAAGLQGEADCTIGLGVPSPKWAEAAEQAIAALAKLGDGSVTFSDADISLRAVPGTPQGRFDDVVGALEGALPQVFALTAVLPPPPDDSAPETPEFTATLSPEGLVQLRGRVASAADRKTVESFASARFSSDGVYTAARVAEGLPEDWTYRILTGLHALSYLSNGVLRITPDDLVVRGWTGHTDAGSMISGLLSERLGEGAPFTLDVRYKKALDPVASLPTPEECQERLSEILKDRKITFEPGSAKIDVNGAQIMDDIADVLKECGEITVEIGGHTDSQGREVMNQQLSQARAQAVLNELRMRRVLTASITAVGYGETRPIADNSTEAGREANRRIEFKVTLPETVSDGLTTLETLEEQAEERMQTPADGRAEPDAAAQGDAETTTATADADATDAGADSEAQEETPNEQN